MDFANIATALFGSLLVIWALTRIRGTNKKRTSALEADITASAIVNHINTTYPRFFNLGAGHYFRTAGVIELNVRDIPLLTKAFAKRSVTLVNAGPEAAVDGFHMELEFAGNTIGVKAYRNIN